MLPYYNRLTFIEIAPSEGDCTPFLSEKQHAANRNDSQKTTQASDESKAYAVCCDNMRDGAQTFSGEGGIRTLGTQKGTPVFETGPFDHSGTSPTTCDRVAIIVMEPIQRQGLTVC